MGALHEVNLECRTDGAFYDVSSRAGYLFNTTIAGIEQADAILLVGTNPRWEAALVNARIRKTWLNRHVKVGLIGEAVDLTYPYMHVGAGPADLAALAAGRGDFAAVLGNAKNPMIIVGAGAFQREDGEAVQALARQCAETFNMVREDWNGFNVLHTAASRVGALDIGFTSKEGFDLGKTELVYLLGADEFPMGYINPDAFVIYQGHHGDAGANRADVILPGAAYTEKNGTYVNMEGRVQMARKAVEPPGEVREDWKIIRALSAYIQRPLPYDDLFQLRERIAREWPHMAQLDQIVPAPWDNFGRAGPVTQAPFVSAVPNFYMTNVITRASVTMAECTKVFLHGDVAEAAE